MRYELPKAVKDRFEHHWQVGLAKKVKSETAALMADRLDAFLSGGIDYPGRAKHVAEVASTITRRSRVRYRREELRRVCDFLAGVPNAKRPCTKSWRLGAP